MRIANKVRFTNRKKFHLFVSDFVYFGYFGMILAHTHTHTHTHTGTAKDTHNILNKHNPYKSYSEDTPYSSLVITINTFATTAVNTTATEHLLLLPSLTNQTPSLANRTLSSTLRIQSLATCILSSTLPVLTI
jgi:hypothetical protein